MFGGHPSFEQLFWGKLDTEAQGAGHVSAEAISRSGPQQRPRGERGKNGIVPKGKQAPLATPASTSNHPHVAVRT